MKPIINRRDAKQVVSKHGDDFEATMEELAAAVGALNIGANITTVQPGKAAFPIHHHYANEEHFYVLSGHGKVRIGADAWPIEPGDYIFSQPGGPEHAHQIVNTGDEPLVYLAISTKKVPEVVGYPDSGKTGVRVSHDMENPNSRFLVSDDVKNNVTYWDDEDGAQVRATLKGK